MDRRSVLNTAAAVGAGLSPTSSRVSAAERVSERRSPMSNANEAVVRLLKTWSERDAKRRRNLVAQTFTEDRTYIDRVREGRGHDGIDAMIAPATASISRVASMRITTVSDSVGWQEARRKRRSTKRGQTSLLSPTMVASSQ